MKTKKELRDWVSGQFYSDVDEKEPSEDYEDWSTEQIEQEIKRMSESLFQFLKTDKKVNKQNGIHNR